MDDVGTMRGAVIGTLGAVASLLFAFFPGSQVADSTPGQPPASSIQSCGLLSTSSFALVSRQIVLPATVASGAIVVRL